MAPISIDGTDISALNIDGTEVQEVTMDGDVVFSSGRSFNTSINNIYFMEEYDLNLVKADFTTSEVSRQSVNNIGSGKAGGLDSDTNNLFVGAEGGIAKHDYSLNQVATTSNITSNGTTHICVLPDGNIFAVAGQSGNAYVFDSNLNQLASNTSTGTNYSYAVAGDTIYLSNDRAVFTEQDNTQITIFDTTNADVLHQSNFSSGTGGSVSVDYEDNRFYKAVDGALKEFDFTLTETASVSHGDKIGGSSSSDACMSTLDTSNEFIYVASEGSNAGDGSNITKYRKSDLSQVSSTSADINEPTTGFPLTADVTGFSEERIYLLSGFGSQELFSVDSNLNTTTTSYNDNGQMTTEVPKSALKGSPEYNV